MSSALRAAPVNAVFRNDQGYATVVRLHPRVVRIELAGRLPADAGDAIATKLGKDLARSDKQNLFWHLDDLESYESAVRVDCTRVLLENRAKLASVHTFTRSRIVAMGVSVANLALGGFFEIHPTEASFEAAQRKLVGA